MQPGYTKPEFPERALAGSCIPVDSRGRRETVTQGLCSGSGPDQAMQLTATRFLISFHFD